MSKRSASNGEARKEKLNQGGTLDNIFSLRPLRLPPSLFELWRDKLREAAFNAFTGTVTYPVYPLHPCLISRFGRYRCFLCVPSVLWRVPLKVE